jgi:hypothetical protein
MTEATKTINYTDEMVETITARYEAEPTKATIEALAAELEKTTRSVIAKLSNLGIYKAQERTTKAGKPVVRKAELVAQVEGALGIKVPSFEKASKQDLEVLASAVLRMGIDLAVREAKDMED